jgi:hypothetical protein
MAPPAATSSTASVGANGAQLLRHRRRQAMLVLPRGVRALDARCARARCVVVDCRRSGDAAQRLGSLSQQQQQQQPRQQQQQQQPQQPQQVSSSSSFFNHPRTVVEAVCEPKIVRKSCIVRCRPEKSSPAARQKGAFGACSEPFDFRPLTEAPMVRLPVVVTVPTLTVVPAHEWQRAAQPTA